MTASLSQTGHVLVLHNVSAGGGMRREEEQRIIRAFFDARTLPCTIIAFDRSHQTIASLNLAEHVQKTGANRLLVAGGDGTIREVVEYMVQQAVKIPIGILPTGSANLLARIVGIPRTLEDALTHAQRAEPHAMDIGILNDRHVFLLCACFGQFARVSLDAEGYWKRRFGFWGYVTAGVRHLIWFHRSAVRIQGERINAHSVLCFLREPARAVLPALIHGEEGLQTWAPRSRTIVGLLCTLFECTVLRRANPSGLTCIASETLTMEGNQPLPLHLDGDRIEAEEHRRTHTMSVRRQAIAFLR
jgi:hypothetical protein